MDWNVAGLLPTTPTAADNLIIISDMAGATWDAKIQNAINLAAGQTGITIIYFPGGIYELTQPINFLKVIDLFKNTQYVHASCFNLLRRVARKSASFIRKMEPFALFSFCLFLIH